MHLEALYELTSLSRKATCHRSSVTIVKIQGGHPYSELAARSPDLNPIENMWSLLKRCVRRLLSGDDLPRLQELLRQERGSISQSTVNRLIESTPSRVPDVIQLCENATLLWKPWERIISPYQNNGSHWATFKTKEKHWQATKTSLTLKMTVPLFLSSTVVKPQQFWWHFVHNASYSKLQLFKRDFLSVAVAISNYCLSAQTRHYLNPWNVSFRLMKNWG